MAVFIDLISDAGAWADALVHSAHIRVMPSGATGGGSATAILRPTLPLKGCLNAAQGCGDTDAAASAPVILSPFHSHGDTL